METLPLIVLAAGSVMLVSLIGVLTIPRLFGDWLQKNLSLLVSFSAGIFAVVVLNLVTEAREVLSLGQIALWVLFGIVLMYVLSKLLPEAHHHHSDECEEKQPGPHALRVLIADAIHNIGDGIILVPAFMVDVTLGIAVLVGIIVHEAVQELSEFFVLRAAGYSARKALLYNFIASSTILLGVMIGWTLLSFGNLDAVLLAVSAGAFSFVVLKDLLPHSLQHAREHGLSKHFMWSAVGAVLMVVIGMLAPHVHGDEEHMNEHAHDEEHADEHAHELEHHEEDEGDHDHSESE